MTARKVVLVTGANGFLGRHVLPLLDGFEVHAIGRKECDLLAPGEPARLVAALRPTHLLHLAWITTPGVYWTSLENLAWLRGSLELLEAFAKSGGRRAVVAGSCAEYDWTAGGRCTAATPLAPATLYGKAKRALHLVLEGTAKEAGLSYGWGRIFFLFGPGEPRQKLVSDLAAKLRAGEKATCRTASLRRDFIYVKDAAAAFRRLLDAEASGAFDVASGEATLVGDVAREVARRLGEEPLLELGDPPAGSREPPLLVGDVTPWRELGWAPRYSIAAAVQEMLS